MVEHGAQRAGGIDVRTATVADAGAIAVLPGLLASTVRGLASDLAATARRHAVVASDPSDGRVVGFAMTTRQEDALHVLDVAVAADRRRRGIATLLVVELARRAVLDGTPAMTLEVRAGNASARALYGSLGFEDHGVRPGYYQDGEDAHVLWHDDPRALARHPG